MAIQSLNEFYKEVNERYAGEEPKRGFKGIWIEREIWLNKNLSLPEKVVTAEICSLDDPKEGCTASNKYLAEFFGFSEVYIKKIIQSLIKKDLVSRGKFNGRQRVLHCNVVTAKRKNKIKRI